MQSFKKNIYKVKRGVAINPPPSSTSAVLVPTGSNSVVTACTAIGNFFYAYYTTPTFDVGTMVWQDVMLTIPFNGNLFWFKDVINKQSVQIGNDGIIQLKVNCP